MLVRHPESVGLVAVEGDEIVVVRQLRRGVETPVVELPAGKIEPGETPLEAAARELAEECCLRATELRELGGFWAVPAYSTEFVHVFEARSLSSSLDALDADEDERIEVARIPLAEALEALSDAVSLASVALWQRRS
jgi:ADP-ribose pyrophosphatase